MKVINIRIIYDWEDVDVENDNIDVFVDTDDGYTYTLSVATIKNVQFLMDEEKMDYQAPDCPSIILKKLTPEILERAVKAFAEDKLDGGYWLKVYHFAGWHGAIDESIFDQLKAKRIEERNELSDEEELTELDELLTELDEFLNFPRI